MTYDLIELMLAHASNRSLERGHPPATIGAIPSLLSSVFPARMPSDAKAATQVDRTLNRAENATCLGCGCLCDDIDVTTHGDQIVEIENACTLGKDWYSRQTVNTAPSSRLSGVPTTLVAAVSRAAELLACARAPLIFGLNHLSIEAQRAVVALADRIGATIDPADSDRILARRLAVQRVGIVSGTLGEVKNRADVVVYWACDPLTSHPRHWQRYAVEPQGRFIPAGRVGRHVVVIDSHRTATAEFADTYIPLADDKHLATLSALRAAALSKPRRTPALPIAPESFRKLAEILSQARFGAFFFDGRLSRVAGGTACVESLLNLVRDLNEPGKRRFVALSLGAPGNAAGIEAVLGWQASAPCSVDYSSGAPRFLPREAGAEARVRNRQADVSLFIGVETIPDLMREALTDVPHIVIGPDAAMISPAAEVAIDTARPSIESGGTVMRADGVMIPLRPVRATSAPSELDVLNAIHNALETRESHARTQ